MQLKEHYGTISCVAVLIAIGCLGGIKKATADIGALFCTIGMIILCLIAFGVAVAIIALLVKVYIYWWRRLSGY